MEVFYDLKRLQEVMANVFRYEGRGYWVKSFSANLGVVTPGLDAYIFDDDKTVLSSYWLQARQDGRPQLEIRGEPFRTFIGEYWSEVWRHGTLLNHAGGKDLNMFQALAFQLGLERGDWPEFVNQARMLQIGDNISPLP